MKNYCLLLLLCSAGNSLASAVSSAAALRDKTLQFIDPSPEPGLKNVE